MKKFELKEMNYLKGVQGMERYFNACEYGSKCAYVCYICFLKCGLVKGKCFSKSETEKNKCHIYTERMVKGNPNFAYGFLWPDAHPLAYAVRSCIIFIQGLKEKGIPKKDIVEYIEKYMPKVASYLKYYRQELNECPSPDSDVERLSKIIRYYTGKKLSEICLPSYPVDYINYLMERYEKNMKEYGRKICYKTTRLPEQN